MRNVGDDNDGDNDNDLIRYYGHEAGADDLQRARDVIRRYYSAASAERGDTACSLIDPTFAAAIAKEYGQSRAAPALRGNTCAIVMSKLFKSKHRQIVTDVATMQVSTLRVKGGSGLAMLYFMMTRPERYMALRLVGSIWKVDSLLSMKLP